MGLPQERHLIPTTLPRIFLSKTSSEMLNALLQAAQRIGKGTGG
jgi:hypothetical protein